MKEEKAKPNLLVVDTNILLSDSEAMKELMRDGNTLCIPWTVVFELDNLKSNRNVGAIARANLKKIQLLQKQENKFLLIEKRQNYSGLKELNSDNPDHQIIAVFNSLLKHYFPNNRVRNAKKKNDNNLVNPYGKIKLISNDTTMIILARELFKDYGDKVLVETYRHNRVKPKLEPITEFRVDKKIPKGIGPGSVFQLPINLKKLKENDGVLLTSPKVDYLAIRKENNLKVLDPSLSVAGIKAQPLNGNGENWSQVLALHQLTDKGICCVFLEGGAGTGKTLLAIAAAVWQSDLYENIVVMRPMVHLSDQDNMGFLPGKIEEKTGPWLKPIEYNLSFIHKILLKHKIELPGQKSINKKKAKKRKNKNQEEDDGPPTLFEQYNVEVQPLDYIRGLTLPNLFAIIDEAQNLTASQIKTIITRAGRGSKFVFTGDLSQIDVKYLTEDTSGLAHAISKLHDNMPKAGNPMIATTIFTDSLRSPLASLAVEKL